LQRSNPEESQAYLLYRGRGVTQMQVNPRFLTRSQIRQVFVEDKLFATLDPTIRRWLPAFRRFALLADTVGFIRNTPA